MMVRSSSLRSCIARSFESKRPFNEIDFYCKAVDVGLILICSPITFHIKIYLLFELWKRINAHRLEQKKSKKSHFNS